MGFAINGTPIPDPAAYSGAISALDASGSRDMTGTLHRDMVATKVPTHLAWEALDWDTIQTILALVKEESFTFTFPNPAEGSLSTVTAYAGDREWDVHYITVRGEYVGYLKFSVIEF